MQEPSQTDPSHSANCVRKSRIIHKTRGKCHEKSDATSRANKQTDPSHPAIVCASNSRVVHKKREKKQRLRSSRTESVGSKRAAQTWDRSRSAVDHLYKMRSSIWLHEMLCKIHIVQDPTRPSSTQEPCHVYPARQSISTIVQIMLFADLSATKHLVSVPIYLEHEKVVRSAGIVKSCMIHSSVGRVKSCMIHTQFPTKLFVTQRYRPHQAAVLARGLTTNTRCGGRDAVALHHTASISNGNGATRRGFRTLRRATGASNGSP